MKKLLSMILAMVMCVSLVACGGGVDKQPAIDAFNSTNTEFAALAQEVNANVDAYSDEFVDLMIEMGESIASAKDLLESDQELTEENVAELVSSLNGVKEWVAEVNVELENPGSILWKQEETGLLESDELLLSDVIDYYNTLIDRFDTIAYMVDEDPSAFSDEFVADMVTVSEGLAVYGEALSSGEEATQEDLELIVTDLTDFDMWLQEVESQLLG